MTGNYPDWWKGKEFLTPDTVWTGSPTNETSRDILQVELLGGLGEKLGTGWMILAGNMVGSPLPDRPASRTSWTRSRFGMFRAGCPPAR
jgi:hypothetical protein